MWSLGALDGHSIVVMPLEILGTVGRRMRRW